MALSSPKWAELAARPEGVTIRQAGPLAFSIARILLLAALMGAPLAFGAVNSWAWMPLGLVASLALLLWAIGSVQQGVLKLIWSPLYVPLAMFFLFGLVQYLGRITFDKSETRQALVLLAADLALFFVTVQLFGGAGDETRRGFGLAVLIFAGSLGLFAILQLGSGTERIYGRFDTGRSTFFGPYGNPDHYAGLMEMLIPVAVFYIAEHNRRQMVLLGLAATVAVTSLLLSGSRAGLLVLIAEIVVASTLVRRRARTTQARRLVTAIAATILAGALLFSWLAPDWIVTRLGSVVTIGSQSWLEGSDFRKTLAWDSLRMLREHPVLGWGLGSFEAAYPRHQSFPSDLSVDYAHDDYVEAVAETGLLGGVFIFSALALFFRLAFRDWGRRLRSEGSWIQFGAAIGCFGLLVHSFLDFNLHVPANAAWFAVLAGIATTDEQPRRRVFTT